MRPADGVAGPVASRNSARQPHGVAS
jgi:hypothetical protein